MKKLAVWFILLAGTLWGCIGIFVRHYTGLGLNSMQIAALRLTLSAVLFTVFILIFNRKLFRIKLKDIWIFLGSGILSVGVFTICYFQSIALSSLSVASILLYTAPVFVMLFSLIFFKEKLTALKIAALLLAVLGCALTVGIIGGGLSVSLAGFLFGLGSGICYALYSIFSRFALDRGYSPLTVTLYTFILAAISVLCICNPIPIAQVITKDVGSFFFSLLFAVSSCVLPYLFYTLGLKYVKSSTASIIATIEPVVATVVGALVFSEAVQIPFGYIGIALVVGSVVLINLNLGRKETIEE
ncbi:MAG: EamA family transporter [Ruminococcus sp.]|nr:EamA family transporter [Ruminococcus sp.]